jgi:hypothetical protein
MPHSEAINTKMFCMNDTVRGNSVQFMVPKEDFLTKNAVYNEKHVVH